ncbi:acyl-CoA dehydrogenase family protein [Marinicella gelatinilytica]|uniref:acyl-CoA dehydrogenase family protein n=1 Tax=Marinicella gelatinilytica TaxID=2996017 RepID=UPI002260D44A|nr:acyl-CoA dehydrogenase family protein [Marinicella gelatinilytica]MCX7544772.1 acyl-CoA dehydrogenase family protein [Marinicella gelatinilytica]
MSKELDKLDLFNVNAMLNDEQRMVKESIGRWVDERFLPLVAEHFEAHTFPMELVPEMADLGLFGSTIQGYDCAGLDYMSYGLICQELERGDSGLRSFASVQSSLCMYPIDAFGSDEQKQRWLPPMARGEVIGCFGLTEAHAGSDPASMKTRAKKDGDDWIINGSKMWITNGSVADIAIVWAQTDDGIQGFIIEKDMPGFDTELITRKMSLRASVTSALFFDDVRVPDSNRLPKVKGLKGPLSCLSNARFGISFGPIGAAQACLQEVLDYTAERVLFDRTLDCNQIIQQKLADMSRRISTAQLLAYRLGQLKDRDELQPTQISMAKWNNVRMALDIARECRDMLGGAGITTEHVAIRHMLNLESVITYEGTETIHQLVVGRELTGKNAF